MTLSVLLVITLTLIVRSHTLECYHCDSDKDAQCPSKNRTCQAEKFCTKIYYQIPGLGRQYTLVIVIDILYECLRAVLVVQQCDVTSLVYDVCAACPCVCVYLQGSYCFSI